MTEIKLTTLEELRERTPKKILDRNIPLTPSNLPLTKFIKDITDINLKYNNSNNLVDGFIPLVSFNRMDYEFIVHIKVLESDIEYEKRLHKLIDLVNEKEKRKIKQDQENADKTQAKYNHYLEMKKWASENDLPI